MKFYCVIIFILSYAVTDAQTPNWNEMFRQKRTQRKYLTQQIAALKVYLNYLKKGYEIVDKGLKTIGDIKNGTFTLDKDYLNSLKQVNSVVSNSPKVHDILVYQQAIIRSFQKLIEDCNHSPDINTEEVEYIQHVYANILIECDNSIDELTLITTSGEAEMKDDERLSRLDKVHLDMLDKYTFTQDFVNGTRLLLLQRAKERTQIQSLKNLHND